MIKFFSLLLLGVALELGSVQAQGKDRFVQLADSYDLPVGGNTWVEGAGSRGLLTNEGLKSWSNPNILFRTYIHLKANSSFILSVLVAPTAASTIQVAFNGAAKNLNVAEGQEEVSVGEFSVKDAGYYTIELKGVPGKSNVFPAVKAYRLSSFRGGGQPDYVRNNEGNYFYWGRRGPSVHMNYPFADTLKAEYFYNEITVPKGNDVIGSYYMANGFGEGYFGIQVNGPTERRVLFSVWSPFHTDDPKSIPDSMKIVMLKKGEGVYTGEFGNEGSGGQSFLRYNWVAGNTYRFLLRGVPDGKNNSTYTAWFYAPEKKEWMLIASFRRPHTNTYLKRFHSFLENFSPDQGDKERKVYFSNQWIRTVDGEWIELTKSRFTGDNTARKRYRLDYGGGVEGDRFFLRNCGFFSDPTPLDGQFERSAPGKKPEIDFSKLK